MKSRFVPHGPGGAGLEIPQGLAPEPLRAYLGGDMHFFSRFNPFRALGDLRRFLASRQRYELYTLFGAGAVTWVIIWAFVIDSKSIEVPYKPNIVYVESWPLDRSDKQIVAQQKIDQVKKDAAQAEFEKKQKERQQQFKKIDDALKRWGI